MSRLDFKPPRINVSLGDGVGFLKNLYGRSLGFSFLLQARTLLQPDVPSVFNPFDKSPACCLSRIIASGLQVIAATEKVSKLVCVDREPTAGIFRRIAGFYSLGDFAHGIGLYCGRSLASVTGSSPSGYWLFSQDRDCAVA
jgi:hypothetical protein